MNGGRRPGAGREKGGKNKKTIEIEIARQRYIQRILQELDPLITAQFDVAKGLMLMFALDWETNKKTGRRVRTGKFIQVTEKTEIEQLLDGEGENGHD